MSLKRTALVIGVLALLGTAFGLMPGRFTTRDLSDCYVFEVLAGPNPREPCIHQFISYTRPAVDVSVVVTMIVIAIGAGLVATFPRRRLAAAWLTMSAFAGFLAYAVTRSWTVRPGETLSLWPRYAAWSVVGAIAAGMFALLIYLIMTDGTDTELPVARVARYGRDAALAKID